MVIQGYCILELLAVGHTVVESQWLVSFPGWRISCSRSILKVGDVWGYWFMSRGLAHYSLLPGMFILFQDESYGTIDISTTKFPIS